MPTDYRVLVGPEGYLLPAAASMEVVLPDKEETLVEGLIVPEEEAMKRIAEKLLSSNILIMASGTAVSQCALVMIGSEN